MPFHITISDITKLSVDAVVNAANNTLLGGGGVDGAIHRAAGPELLEECRKLGGCETGKAKITGGYNLPSKYIIHTVGPIYTGKDENEEALLRNCYRNSLEVAKENNLESIAFPLISAGAYGYPKDEAMKIAKDEIIGFIRDNDMDVTLCIYDKSALSPKKYLRPDIDNYIFSHISVNNNPYGYGSAQVSCQNSMPYGDACFAPLSDMAEKRLPHVKTGKKRLKSVLSGREKTVPKESVSDAKPTDDAPVFGNAAPAEFSIEVKSFIPELDESFSEMLMRKIDEKGIKDSECYFRANVDRRLFSKIRSSRDYRPSKETAVAFAIALELDMKETEEMLRKAGYALSDSFMFDVIVKYYIENRKYDIFEINETLFRYDQKTF